MSHSQFHSINSLYLDMHGLIFETSIWLLAGSTRFDFHSRRHCPTLSSLTARFQKAQLLEHTCHTFDDACSSHPTHVHGRAEFVTCNADAIWEPTSFQSAPCVLLHKIGATGCRQGCLQQATCQPPLPEPWWLQAGPACRARRKSAFTVSIADRMISLIIRMTIFWSHGVAKPAKLFDLHFCWIAWPGSANFQ